MANNKGQTTIYKTLRRSLKIEKNESPKIRWSGNTSINIKIYVYIYTLKEILNDINDYFYNKEKERQMLVVYRLFI